MRRMGRNTNLRNGSENENMGFYPEYGRKTGEKF